MKWLIAVALLLAFPLRRWFLAYWYMILPAILGAILATKILELSDVPKNWWFVRLAVYALLIDVFAKLGRDWAEDYRGRS